MVKAHFKCIGILAHNDHLLIAKTLNRLLDFMHSQPMTVMVEECLKPKLTAHLGLTFSTREQMCEFCDLVIVIGGDGTLLSAARHFADHPVSLLGINRGKLGFLTDINPEDLEKFLPSILAGHYMSEERFLLQAKVIRNGTMVATRTALNDTVLHPGHATRMIAFELAVNGQFVCSYKADGLIVSTPTGSTAYALSAGGPLLHPGLEALVLVPMYPHMLSSRPMVVSSQSVINIVIHENPNTQPSLSFDGQEEFSCESGDQIVIERHKHGVRFIHPLNHNYFDTCRQKLGWENRHYTGD